MTKLRALIERLHTDQTGASLSVLFVGLTVSLLLIIGFVVDSAGKYQRNEQAQTVAAAAARAATNAISANTVVTGSLTLNDAAAINAGNTYIAAAGMTGTTTITGTTVNVHVTTTYQTEFLSLIGIDTIPANADASAQLITQ